MREDEILQELEDEAIKRAQALMIFTITEALKEICIHLSIAQSIRWRKQNENNKQ